MKKDPDGAREFLERKQTEKEIPVDSGSHYVNGAIPPEMRSIAPDYFRWRKQLLLVNLALAITVLALEFMMIVLKAVNGESDPVIAESLWQDLLLPSLINFSVVGLEAHFMKKAPGIDRLQNNITMITMTVVCAVVACVHCEFENTMTVLCLPVLTSVVFCSKELTLVCGFTGTGGLIIAFVCRLFKMGGNDPHLLPETVIAFITLFVSQFIAGLVNAITFGQRKKLVGAISEAKLAQREAVEVNNAKSVFLANMSHEIRTPINAILGMNEMILREEKDPEVRRYSANIQMSGNSLLSIINDVLDISKIESGRLELVPSTYEISSLINDCYNMAADRAKSKGLELKVECGKNLPRMLYGDETRIRQIVVNLLTNAVKYTEKGTVTLRVENDVSDDLRAVLKVTVSDTGIGIAEQDIDRLFEQFRRLDLQHNRNIEGTGLGLTIVKRLVDLMGGTILVRSELGKGSDFIVYMPQEIVDETPLGDIQLNFSRTVDFEYVRKFEAPEARILVVDDVPMNLMVITGMLKESKMTIETATSGKKAIELCEQNHYDLILMDHMMPEMDGIEAYYTICEDEKSLCRNTPTIMLTANAISGMREQYMSVGFADYISKPVRSDKLEESIMQNLPPWLVKTDITVEKAPTKEAPADDAGNAAYPELEPLLKALPQMNLALAMPYCCDDAGLFMEILREYAGNTRLEDMKKAYEEERFDDYRRNAHSLKSTSLTVGLEGLSERARASEFALKCGNMELVRMNHSELMEMYESALTKIREFLQDK